MHSERVIIRCLDRYIYFSTIYQKTLPASAPVYLRYISGAVAVVAVIIDPLYDGRPAIQDKLIRFKM